jgi:hypothetical protein
MPSLPYFGVSADWASRVADKTSWISFGSTEARFNAWLKECTQGGLDAGTPNAWSLPQKEKAWLLLPAEVKRAVTSFSDAEVNKAWFSLDWAGRDPLKHWATELLSAERQVGLITTEFVFFLLLTDCAAVACSLAPTAMDSMAMGDAAPTCS